MAAQAMLTLFRCLTGESYNGIMHDLMPTSTVLARCDAAPADRPNCGTWASIPFFISFYVLGAMVALNLVVAVVLDAFADDADADADAPPELSEADLEAFIATWTKHDPDASGFISTEKLRYLLRDLPSPLGMGGEKSPARFVDRLRALGIPDRNGHANFHEVRVMHRCCCRLAEFLFLLLLSRRCSSACAATRTASEATTTSASITDRSSRSDYRRAAPTCACMPRVDARPESSSDARTSLRRHALRRRARTQASSAAVRAASGLHEERWACSSYPTHATWAIKQVQARWRARRPDLL